MATKYWCDFCERTVPKHKKKATSQAGSWVILFIGGFFTCGLTWIFMILLPFIQVGEAAALALVTVCPICGANTHVHKVKKT